MVAVVEVSEANVGDVRAFLARHEETTLFLASNLARHGYRPGDALNSGTFKSVVSAGEIVGVFCLTRRGNLLIETGGRTDAARLIVEACAGEPNRIVGVLGEWRAAHAVGEVVRELPGYEPRTWAKEVLFRLELSRAPRAQSARSNARPLAPADFAAWNVLNLAFTEESGIPLQSSLEQRQAQFEWAARESRYWGYFADDELCATVALSAVHETTGQVGGVFTARAARRRGYARVAMEALIADSVLVHGLKKLILFTGEENNAARALYVGLGFEPFGEYALLFGSYAQEVQ